MLNVRCEACDAMLHEADMSDGLCPDCKHAVAMALDETRNKGECLEQYSVEELLYTKELQYEPTENDFQ